MFLPFTTNVTSVLPKERELQHCTKTRTQVRTHQYTSTLFPSPTVTFLTFPLYDYFSLFSLSLCKIDFLKYITIIFTDTYNEVRHVVETLRNDIMNLMFKSIGRECIWIKYRSLCYMSLYTRQKENRSVCLSVRSFKNCLSLKI